eukprot:g9214.t1
MSKWGGSPFIWASDSAQARQPRCAAPARLPARSGMKLMTHNLLKCNKKGETPYEQSFVSAMIPKLEYGALLKALAEIRECPKIEHVEKLGALPSLPEALPASPESDEEFLKALHTILFDLDLIEGQLICPESGRVFPVNDGIPNMLLNDDEGSPL